MTPTLELKLKISRMSTGDCHKNVWQAEENTGKDKKFSRRTNNVRLKIFDKQLSLRTSVLSLWLFDESIDNTNRIPFISSAHKARSGREVQEHEIVRIHQQYHIIVYLTSFTLVRCIHVVCVYKPIDFINVMYITNVVYRCLSIGFF